MTIHVDTKESSTQCVSDQEFKTAISMGNLVEVRNFVEVKNQVISDDHLECAAGNGQKEVLLYLFDKTRAFNIYEKPLFRAFHEGKTEIVTCILERDPDLLTVLTVSKKAKQYSKEYRDPHGYDTISATTHNSIIQMFDKYSHKMIARIIK